MRFKMPGEYALFITDGAVNLATTIVHDDKLDYHQTLFSQFHTDRIETMEHELKKYKQLEYEVYNRIRENILYPSEATERLR